MLKRISLTSISLLFILTCSAFAQQGTIHGKVRLPSGVTLNGVIVELWQQGSNLSQTVSNTEGDFYFNGLIPANYEIVISHQGYQRVSERAIFRMPGNMNQREVVEVEIRLTPIEKENAKASAGTTFVQDVPPEARELFKQGFEKLKDGKADEGLPLLDQAIQIFPDYFDAHLAKATELSKQEKLTNEALRSLERARSINDRDARVWHLFGILMARQQKYIIADFAFREATQRDPLNSQTRYLHALALIEVAIRENNKFRYELFLAEAEQNLHKAYELSGQKQTAAYLHIARVYEIRGNKKEAIKHLETFLKLSPDDSRAPAIREAIAKLSQ